MKKLPLVIIRKPAQRSVTRWSAVPRNQVLHMPAETLLANLPDGSIDMILTSPPYDNLRTYKGFSWNFPLIARESYRVLKPGGVLVWVVGDATIDGSETLTSFKQALYFRHVGFNLHDTMIYEALGTGAKGSNYAYWQAFEFMFVCSKGKPLACNLIADVKNKSADLSRLGRHRENGKAEKPHKTLPMGKRTNIWRYKVGFMDNSDKTGHPAPFPELLAGDHIRTWSNPGDLVLDYFGGSGTSAKMARFHGRDYLTCDISAEYCDLIRERLRLPFEQHYVKADMKLDDLPLFAGVGK